MSKRYRATKNPDGTWNIHGVEVFAALRKGDRGGKVKTNYDAAWMRAAIDTARMREGEAYKYRCHVAHHMQGEATRPAGFIRLTDVRPITYSGETVDALFADIVGIPPSVFADILDGGLPYRSVEIMNDTGMPQVDTLALLSTTPPHFRFAVLDRDTIEIDESADVPEPVAAFAALKSAQLIGVGEHHPMKTMTLSVTADGALIGKTEGGAIFHPTDGTEPKQREFVLHTPEGDYVAQFAATETPPADLDAIKLDNDALRLRAEKAEAALASAKTTTSADVGDAVKLQARLDALEEDRREREAADKAKLRADSALSGLGRDGWHVPDRCKESIVKLAANADESLLDTYVEEFKATRPKDPVRLRGSNHAPESETVPDAVLKFSADGPDAFEKALALSTQYDSLAAAGMARDLTREQFIDSHMTPLAVRS